MQLTKHTDYALRALMYLGQLAKDDRLVTITELSEQFKIPKNHLMKVINELSHLGYVDTVRGSRGGVRISNQAFSVPLGKMIGQLEAKMDLIDCDQPVCPVRGFCALKSALLQAQSAFIRSLNEYTLDYLIENSKGVARLITIDRR